MMFEYIDDNSFLNRLNPICKLWVIVFVTILICVSKSIIFNLLTIFLCIVFIVLSKNIQISLLINKMKIFIVATFFYIITMTILSGLSSKGDLHFLYFNWDTNILENITLLGTRILSIGILSIGFVISTEAKRLIMSLIFQLHVPDMYAYFILIAYNYIPNLKKEISTIKNSMYIRGINPNNNLLERIKFPFSLFIPLLFRAVKRAEKVSISMESRGFNEEMKRTHLKKEVVNIYDYFFLIISTIIFITIFILF